MGTRTALAQGNVWLRLGRVSNLPTVWSNVLAALALGGLGAQPPGLVLGLLIAFSLAYVAGMFLNDAFDRHIDARERPERPIPSGEVSATQVFLAGFGLLGSSILGLVGLAAASPGGSPLGALLGGGLLASAIVLYDVRHKGNPLSPVLMGLCRSFVYLATGLALSGSVTQGLVLGAVGLLGHVVGITYAARHEAQGRLRWLWPLACLGLGPLAVLLTARAYPIALLAAWLLLMAQLAVALRWLMVPRVRSVPRAVVRLIAAIALLDAALCAGAGQMSFALICVGCFVVTVRLQKVIAGT